MKKIIIIGSLPPPIHGAAKNLKLFFDNVSSNHPTTIINISPGQLTRGLFYHLRKLSRVIFGIVKLFFLAARKDVSSIYMCPDGGFGSYYSLIFVIIANLFNLPLYLHHRSFLYLNKQTVGMRLIKKYEPRDTCHIFLCEKMKDLFNIYYDSTTDMMIVSNAQYVRPVEKVSLTNDVIVLGHLSNLGFEKGLRHIFNVCDSLQKLSIPFKLQLGGPTESKEVQMYLDEMLIKFGDCVNYHGQVSSEHKSNFYTSIDIFLFPTEYRNEAQPNVVFEANAHGVPVFSINTGCISADIGPENGFVFENPKDFIDQAPHILKALANDKCRLFALKNSTLSKIKFESNKSKKSYEALLERVTNH